MPRENNAEMTAVHVAPFPAVVWRVFTAHCKARGRRVRDVLEDVLRKWIKEQERWSR